MKVGVFLSILFFSVSAFSDTACPKGKIDKITIENTKIMYTQEGTNYRTLGLTTEAGVPEKLSIMLAAQMSGKEVTIIYSADGYNCATPNYSDYAKAITVHGS